MIEENEIDRRERDNFHRKALDLAEQLRSLADSCNWGITVNKLYEAAESLEWQVRWEKRHA